MRIVLTFLLLAIVISGQDTTYWQNGYFHYTNGTVVSLSADTHIFTTSVGKVQKTYDNFKSSSDFSSHYCDSFDALVYDKFLLYGHSSYIYRLNIETGQEKRLGQVPAWQFLYCNDSLFYTQSLENEIYRSTDQGENWTFVRNASLYHQWAATPGGEILLVSSDHNVYLSNLEFTDTTLLIQYSGGSSFDCDPYFTGSDTIMFTTSKYLYKSVDGGSSFETTEFESFIQQGVKNDINGNLYILTDDKLLKSIDKGDSWFPILHKYGSGGGFHIYEDKINVAFADHQNDAMYHDPDVSSPQHDNYMPLALGNKWFYRALDRFNQYREVEIYDTVTINSNLYYKKSDFQYPMRYENNRLLYYANGADSLYMDFNTVPGQPTWFRYFEDYYTVREGVFEQFDSSWYNKGPYYSGGLSRECELFAPDLGKVFSSSYEAFWPTIYLDDSLLVQAIIKSPDGDKSYNSIPAPLIHSHIDVDYYSDYLVTRIDVSHSYSGSPTADSVIFIDSVKMYYFLTDGINNTETISVTGERIFDLEKYAFSCPVDTSLFSWGYELKCYYRAWTKGIIPVEKRHPELGYVTINASTVNLESEETALKFSLKNNYPNPFNPSTKISYSLAKSSFVTLDVFNIQGEKVTTIVSKQQASGEYNVKFDGSDLASGIYIAKLRATDDGNEVFSKSIKMILMK
ncbi:MAG: hypothetical protein SCALA702_34040 [Melioribacteraceae bacterium]|nr:MAG: hypothetical protein SCALA702_34040 [Melioribacteraceae bacterium]